MYLLFQKKSIFLLFSLLLLAISSVTAQNTGSIQGTAVNSSNNKPLPGVKNITDEQYVNHLNAKNPFTGMAIPEPGRIFFGDITIRF